MPAPISDHFRGRKPSPIRQAQILFAKRPDRDAITVVNLAIGNVSLPMHPAMRARLNSISENFADGVVKYTASVGSQEAQDAFMNIIASCGASTEALNAVVTDGGSQAMELMILGTCGPGCSSPLMLIDPAYTNYMDIARRLNVRTVSLGRDLGDDGIFAAPDLVQLEAAIKKHKPPALVVIPADNPTGQFLPQSELIKIARLATQYDMWLVSDEAYRQLHYQNQSVSSVWLLDEKQVPGITGRRISIESASKVWNACGLRIGALVTDNAEFHGRAVAEYTANLCSNAIGQHVFAALAEQSHEQLHAWYKSQREYYSQMMRSTARGLHESLPGVIVSNTEASLYAVLDVKNVAPSDFCATSFVQYCAERGSANLDGQPHTLLVAPMAGFYGARGDGQNSAAATQMRLAFVEPPAAMKKVPRLFAELFHQYLGER